MFVKKNTKLSHKMSGSENVSWDVNMCMAAGDLQGINTDISIKNGQKYDN